MAKTKFIDTTKMSSGEEKVAKPIEFTEYMSRITGWVPSSSKPSDYAEVKYLGKCERDGDKFAATSDDGVISIYKGHLNDGFIED